jgi:hypothetical protein
MRRLAQTDHVAPSRKRAVCHHRHPRQRTPPTRQNLTEHRFNLEQTAHNYTTPPSTPSRQSNQPSSIIPAPPPPPPPPPSRSSYRFSQFPAPCHKGSAPAHFGVSDRPLTLSSFLFFETGPTSHDALLSLESRQTNRSTSPIGVLPF